MTAPGVMAPGRRLAWVRATSAAAGAFGALAVVVPLLAAAGVLAGGRRGWWQEALAAAAARAVRQSLPTDVLGGWLLALVFGCTGWALASAHPETALGRRAA